jgi:hypothetical protein
MNAEERVLQLVSYFIEKCDFMFDWNAVVRIKGLCVDQVGGFEHRSDLQSSF